MLGLWSVTSGAFLGWTLGANDASNVFGVAVSTRVVKYWVAVTLTAIFVIIGALFDGAHGIENLSNYSFESGVTTVLAAFLVMLAAGITVMGMTILSLPVSTSQCVVGSVIGYGLLQGQSDLSATLSFLGAWIITPIGAGILGFLMYYIAEKLISDKKKSLNSYDRIIKIGYYVAGIFGAYSLGANNVANITALYSGELALISTTTATLIGGFSIAIGVLTYSRKVMYTVGEKITSLNQLSGFLVVFSCAIVVYIFAQIGIPVSSSQAIVGAVVGVGLTKGIATVNFKVIRNIFFAWFGTPTISCLISLCFAYVATKYL